MRFRSWEWSSKIFLVIFLRIFEILIFIGFYWMVIRNGISIIPIIVMCSVFFVSLCVVKFLKSTWWFLSILLVIIILVWSRSGRILLILRFLYRNIADWRWFEKVSVLWMEMKSFVLLRSLKVCSLVLYISSWC